MMRAMPTASLRSLLLICIFSAAFACLASIQMIGRQILSSSVHSHVDVAPVSRPIRTTCGACDLMKAAMASGFDETVPSRTIFPIDDADRCQLQRHVQSDIVFHCGPPSLGGPMRWASSFLES